MSLVLLTAMVFMKVIEANGLLAELTQSLIALLGRSRAAAPGGADHRHHVPRDDHGILHRLGARHRRHRRAGADADGPAARDDRRRDLERGGLRHDRPAGERAGDDHRRRHRHALRRVRPGARRADDRARRS
ncbi:MAG: hypothetical protein MZV49_25145 [Rhodopseudomonas palustris]|nr:hypothetical protein [Rhodopseudomonas palustris]